MTVQIWKLTWVGGNEKFFTRRDLAIRSIRLSYSNIPDMEIHDKGKSILVEWPNKTHGGMEQEFFVLENPINNHVYDTVEHL